MRFVGLRKKSIKTIKKGKNPIGFCLSYLSDRDELHTPSIRIDPLFRITISSRGKRPHPSFDAKRRYPSSTGHVPNAVVDDSDPRACPKDIDAFRLALSVELDRLRERKLIYDE